jgi:hypothetical protein
MRKLKKLQLKHLDCLDDNEYIGIFISAVMDYTKTQDVKKLLSWQEFTEVVRKKVITLELNTWKWNEYAIDGIIKSEHIFDEETRKYDIKIPILCDNNRTIRLAQFDLQIDANGPEDDKYRGTPFQKRFTGVLSIHWHVFTCPGKKVSIKTAKELKKLNQKEHQRMIDYVKTYGGPPNYGLLPEDF